jgi:RNA-directed DNA polymerase
MDFSNYEDTFTKEARKMGYTTQNIKRCLDYAEILFSNDVPVIYNSAHLAGLVGYKTKYLKKAALHTKYFYRDFEILKKNGKKRPISEPLPSLKEIQLWILKNILYKRPVSPFAKAYKPTVSLIENLKFHKNQPKVFTLDLENFFPSITIKSVQKVFAGLGYTTDISSLLSKLCTRDSTLPQGAPTSPYLSNLIFEDTDAAISEYCIKQKIRYTRYADDMSFSGDFDENALLDKVTTTIEKLKLKINTSKTKLMTPDRRQSVTGIVVNEKLQVVFHKRNKLRQAMYYIQKFGIDEHREYREINQVHFLEHLLGKINFVLQINPKDAEFIEYKSYLKDLKKKRDARSYKIAPLLM